MSQNPYVAGGAEPSDDEGGAFAVTGEVTWNNGFGTEDLAGAAPTTPAAPATRPAAPGAAPTMPQQRPVAPQQPNTSRPVVPAPAAQRPAPPAPQAVPVAPVPVRPVAPTPATPHPPAATRPATPPPAAPTQPRHAAPPTPPAPPVEVTAQPPAPYLSPAEPVAVAQPAPNRPDLTTPEWATIRPNTHDDSDQRVTSAFSTEAGDGIDLHPIAIPRPEPVIPTPVVAEPPAQPARGKGRAKANNTAPAKAKPGRGGSMAGGRWKIKLLRGAFYTIGGVFLLGGMRATFLPRPVPDVNAITTQVRADMGDNGFPTASADAFAVRFVNTYLTYSDATRDQRMQQLALYSQDAAAGKWGLTSENNRSQSVVSGPFVAAQPQATDKHNATITVAAQVNSGVWVYLAVPVYAADNGALVVSGPPAFVAPPARATSPGAGPMTQTDDELSVSLSSDVFTGYFQAWAKSDTTALARYTTPDASVAALTGLGGSVTLRSVSNVKVPKAGGDTRDAQVDVVWANPAIGSYTQSYRVTVAKQQDGRWYVKDIKGGVISEGSASAANDAAPSPTPSTN